MSMPDCSDDLPEIISNTGPNRGHNLPPSDHVTAVQDLDEALQPFADRRDQFVAAANRAVLRDRASIGDAGDIIHLARQVWEKIDLLAREARQPFRATAERIKARADEFWQPVFNAHDTLQARIDDWMAEENQRIEDQRAEQEAVLGSPAPSAPTLRMAAMPGASRTERPVVAAAPKVQPIRGDLGSRVSRRQDVKIEVIDVHAVPDFILKSPAVTEAIIATVRAMAKAGTDIPGIRTAPITKTSIS